MLGEHQQRCLVDTRAAVSLVNKDTVIRPIRECTRVGGENFHILGMTDIPLGMNNFYVVHTLLIVEMQNQCTLCADFLKANGMVLDIGHGRLSSASGQAPLLIAFTVGSNLPLPPFLLPPICHCLIVIGRHNLHFFGD